MVRKSRVLAVIPLAAAAVAVALLFPQTRALLGQSLARARMPREKHVAVLPFASTSGDPSDQAFCDGLLDVVTSGLTRLSETRDRLWVVPVSDIRVIGRATQGVRLMKMKKGDRVVTVSKVVKAEEEEKLLEAAETLDKKVSDVDFAGLEEDAEKEE